MQTTYAQQTDTVQRAADNTAAAVHDNSPQSESLQRHASLANAAVQRAENPPRPNNTGLPDDLKNGVESLSGYSLDNVRVHYNSPKPATVQALAYTQGTDIHVAPGQEHALPHEAWHVTQQMAGRVSPTTNINGMPVNDNAALEHEADVMGEMAVQCKMPENGNALGPVQRLSGGYEGKAPLQRKGEKPISIKDSFDESVKSNIKNINKNFNELLNDPKKNSPANTFLWTYTLLNYKSGNKSIKDVKKYKTLSKNVIRLQKSLVNFGLLFDEIETAACMPEIYDRVVVPELKRALGWFIRFKKRVPGIRTMYYQHVLKKIADGKECDFSKNVICNKIKESSSKGKSSSEKITDESQAANAENTLDENVNKAFNECVNFIVEWTNVGSRKPKVLDQRMILYGENKSGTIWDYVNEQIKCYPDDFNMQISNLILGCARGIAYLLGDPAAENRIARHLTKTIESKVKDAKKETSESEKKKIFDFNKVGALARTNPLLMYVNREINSQDASHLILVRGMRYFGKIGVKEQKKCFEEMLCILFAKLLNELDAMEKTNSLISGSDKENFSPAKLGMFGLLRKDGGNLRWDIIEKITFEKAKKGFKNPDVGPATDHTPAWLEKANKHKLKLLNENNNLTNEQYKGFLKDFSLIKEKLDKAPITIRLHSSDLKYQNDDFYHAKPWFKSMNIGEKEISYHPSSGRDGANHYSLWRTYKDNLFRGKLWKKGKDAETQSIAKGAIQQNFGALNYGFESNCYGLIGGYDYGNVSLVLEDSIKLHCLYTLGDKGVSYPDVDSLALALALGTSTEDKFLKGAGSSRRKTIRKDIINNENSASEHLEVQIFKDVEFAKDVKKIVCVAVTDDEYDQLCRMVGGDKSKVERY